MSDTGSLATVGPALSRPAMILVVMGAWALVGLLSASQYFLASLSAGGSPDLGRQLLRELPGWQAWSLLTPLVFVVSRRFPLRREEVLRSLPAHLVAATACGFLAVAAWTLSARLAVPTLRSDYAFADLFWSFFRVRFNVAFLLYWTLVALFYGVSSYRRVRELELGAARAELETSRAREEAARAREELTAARLQALRSQLHPHFLFNTLHSIASYMEADVQTARRLVARLGDLLRTVLESHEAAEVPLSDELAFLDQYLEIERIRFGERLLVEYDVAPDTEEALVPPLVLQPLVENAVRHGVSLSETGGTVSIRARRADGRLLLEVQDTGRGFADVGGRREHGPDGSGIGLANTRARLRHLYREEHAIRVISAPSSGTVVSVEIPYRTSREPEEGGHV